MDGEELVLINESRRKKGILPKAVEEEAVKKVI
jgi:hypothetical protein